MRATTLARKLVGVTGLVVRGLEFEERGVVVDVRPRRRKPRCSGCGRKAPGYDQRGPRRWRHLGPGSVRLWLRYAPRRVRCRDCGVRTEQVPWAAAKSRFTYEFEELTAYLAQVTDKTKVTELMGVSWSTVGDIVERVVERRLEDGRLDGLRRIGIDEFSHRKGHRYLTTIVDHDRRRVVWAAPGRSAETLAAFFAELGPERTAAIETVTTDMAGGYLKALAEHAPHAAVVFDRFHVQRLASDALDEVRRAEVRGAETRAESRAVKRTRFPLLKRHWNLTRTDRQKLKDVQANNRRLYRAYLLHAALAHTLDYRQPGHATRALKDWLAWASRSRLKPFVRVARTIRRHFDGVVAYFRERLTNGIVEGFFNNRLRMIARRAFGFHSPHSLISMLFLCCGGIKLDPPLP